ncbi:hypothetical protein A2W67_01100 [Candidatus Nomurabacteria bacterium RIFCSPLOWO2_02_40_28]|nr:MAG: hypothetical protein A2W50_01405 [Candidatus Nomurabacteria bacterium RIFCSPHIGHO2_02_40_30]OGI79858.1 MAG: hypothetical protein A2W43_01835 [Candidatus Nomurabacteria bacterium RIFCSPHIGHO2_12_40_11]OGI82600.1 MAG: hypothetical protein A3E33_02410 [Candidatus Nomurabacteria bacterium RIFCSPHIGHO2_12_FULL_40_77]OGI96624.1 MAG: hypothetical protein A2W67_01100 [Candidatus Nomurabacteria bacterium RIFCSPLOWO2_02_40_28]OGI99155.1 MAG: hypothetical protein A2W78_02490 [Candidatus Nomurabact
MEKIRLYKYIVLIMLVFLGFIFYWYSYRPTQIRKECGEEATISGSFYSRTFEGCLSKHGLEK